MHSFVSVALLLNNGSCVEECFTELIGDKVNLVGPGFLKIVIKSLKCEKKLKVYFSVFF